MIEQRGECEAKVGVEGVDSAVTRSPRRSDESDCGHPAPILSGWWPRQDLPVQNPVRPGREPSAPSHPTSRPTTTNLALATGVSLREVPAGSGMAGLMAASEPLDR